MHTLQQKAARNVLGKSAVQWPQGRQRDDGIRVTHLVSPLSNVIAGTLWHYLPLRAIIQLWRIITVSFKGIVPPKMKIGSEKGRLWLRGRASVLLSEGRWFDSPGMHVEVSLGEILNPKLLLMCMAATAINVWMYVDNSPKVTVMVSTSKLS